MKNKSILEKILTVVAIVGIGYLLFYGFRMIFFMIGEIIK